ncbi:hypothetical protein K505DRAFT_72273 [Melanomma pulvis-pyrius CBS 109.77]|uniref:Uncharacterized protein n=1 Tax=Melanomma pulvis-pyrius CBS 109.77 TaxID=1314802 RepID=A0A6A6X444_9PLEO|nr:hypothetical protein K505DRAFT_72273 [Melanomma pulvis-pyrius CBS 109.77]
MPPSAKPRAQSPSTDTDSIQRAIAHISPSEQRPFTLTAPSAHGISIPHPSSQKQIPTPSPAIRTVINLSARNASNSQSSPPRTNQGAREKRAWWLAGVCSRLEPLSGEVRGKPRHVSVHMYLSLCDVTRDDGRRLCLRRYAHNVMPCSTRVSPIWQTDMGRLARGTTARDETTSGRRPSSSCIHVESPPADRPGRRCSQRDERDHARRTPIRIPVVAIIVGVSTSTSPQPHLSTLLPTIKETRIHSPSIP